MLSQTADQWQSSNVGGVGYATCLTPLPLSPWGYSFGNTFFNVCGGQSTMNNRPLQDSQGNVWGE